jgi:hypothetical protein
MTVLKYNSNRQKQGFCLEKILFGAIFVIQFMAKKREIDIEIDKLTNSKVNILTGDVLQTEFHPVSKKEVKKKDCFFDWHSELVNKETDVYKMIIKDNETIIQGLISVQVDNGFVSVNLVENAKFNRGKKKMDAGVGGNMFAFACLKSKELGLGGYVGFVAKTSLIEYYNKALGAQLALGQRMYIGEESAEKLINQYFKKK